MRTPPTQPPPYKVRSGFTSPAPAEATDTTATATNLEKTGMLVPTPKQSSILAAPPTTPLASSTTTTTTTTTTTSPDEASSLHSQRFQQLLGSYFQWKSMYERESKFVRKQLYDEYLVGKHTKEEYSSMAQNLVHPCVRCSSKEGMKFQREVCRIETVSSHHHDDDHHHYHHHNPTVHVYRGICCDLQKPCMHIELSTGEVADYTQLFVAKKKEVAQMEKDIVLLKLDTMFQYKTPSEALEIFHGKKKEYQVTKFIHDACQTTAECLAREPAELGMCQSTIDRIESDLALHYEKYAISQFELSHEFEMAGQCEKALLAEQERRLLLLYRDITVDEGDDDGDEGGEEDEEEGGEDVEEEGGSTRGGSRRDPKGPTTREQDEDNDSELGVGGVVDLRRRRRKQRRFWWGRCHRRRQLIKTLLSTPPRHCILHNNPPKIVHFHCIEGM